MKTNTPDGTTDKRLQQRARELYHEAARRIDPVTAGRLRAARREALAGTRHAPLQHPFARWLVPSGACAVIALAAVLAWPTAPRSITATPTAVTAIAGNGGETDNMLPPDPEQADPNLYQNLDFYGWLAAHDDQPPTR
ncbi:hypothetical protein [Rhodanobacter sp. PCA2]|uniref:hypothetical protein n=1 Tax=Rhodanobacter sp. PCA2 TaxID=2006117 RepID=UPI0015E73465|nr:hypothetical protein [Rhodanobacter sp. PCA2]MBA2077498.1 hypothetical protein [Rhodanobacter sp. PCA2]